MKTERIHFNEKTIASLPLPTKEEGTKIYYDTGCENLSLIVSYGGSKTYYFLKFFQKRPLRIKIGKTSERKLIEARDEVTRLNCMVAEGKRPTNQRLDMLKDVTIKEMYEQHYKPKHSEVYKRAKSISNDDKIFDLYLKKIHNRQLQSLSKNELTGFISDLMRNKSVYTANRTLALLSHMYAKAIEWYIVPESFKNPTKGIKKFPEKSRDRFMSGDEIRRFFLELSNSENPMFVNYVLLSLFLGQRRNNILSMRWSDVNFEQSTIRFEETKNGESLTVPLTIQAEKLLRNMYNNRTSDEWIFPSPNSATGHYQEPKTAWKGLLKRAGIDNLRIHDLRRTMGSYQAISGTSELIIGRSLGHKSLTATQIYARLSDDPVRESMQRSTDMIMGFVE